MEEEKKPVINTYNSPDEVPEELRQTAKEGLNITLKQQRNNLLKETDKYLLPDFPITTDNLIKIKEYRQLLRDFTNNNYILPDKPDFIS